MATLGLGDRGPEVRELQKLLTEKGYPTEVDGVFGDRTLESLLAFQSQNVDKFGDPLAVDGLAGPLTLWSLRNPKVHLAASSAAVPRLGGGSPAGLAALNAAMNEMNQGACEQGGDNRGPFVAKYLNGLAPEGSSWCAGFVSWCFSHAPGGIPFEYSVGARDIGNQFNAKGWFHKPLSGYTPQPGDIVLWWRGDILGWQGHIGLVAGVQDGFLHTIEGNKSACVKDFRYVLDRVDKLLGFGHAP